MEIRILCEEFCDYSSVVRGYSKETIRRYRYVITSFCKITGLTDINDVTEEKMRALFYYGRIERKWSVNTYLVYYKSLIVFFRWCMKQGYLLLKKNPLEDIETPKLESRLPVHLTKQNALRLLEVIYNYPYTNKFLRERNHAIFATFVFAGLRRQELLNLKYADVDLENLTLFVRQGKGNKDRIVPISHTLAHSLRRYVEERKRRNKTCPEFFTSLNRNQRYSGNSLKKLVEMTAAATGIKFSVHKLRHTFATLMLEGGCDIYSLSKMMGHNNIQTTTIYLAASVEHMRGQMTKHPLNEQPHIDGKEW